MWDDLRRELEMDPLWPAARRGAEEGPGAEDSKEDEEAAIVPAARVAREAAGGSVRGGYTSLGRQHLEEEAQGPKRNSAAERGPTPAGAWAKSPRRPHFRCNTTQGRDCAVRYPPSFHQSLRNPLLAKHEQILSAARLFAAGASIAGGHSAAPRSLQSRTGQRRHARRSAAHLDRSEDLGRCEQSEAGSRNFAE